MNAMESWLFGYLLNALWQVPMIFASALFAARLVRRMNSRIEHRVWITALLLEPILPACSLRPGELLQKLAPWVWRGGVVGGQVRVAMGPGATTHEGGILRLSSEALTVLAMAYGCSLLYFSTRLVWGMWSTRAMRQQAVPMMLTGDAERSWKRYSRILGADAAELAASSRVSGPVTVGIWRGVLLAPLNFFDNMEAGDLDAVFAHEFAHMRRHDFAKNLLYELWSLPIACHPVLWMTRSRIAESREMVCDAMAAEAVAGRESYARSLLRLASMITNRTPVKTTHAIGIFDANIFERRVMNLTGRHAEIQGVRRLAIAATCSAVALATCGTALALRMEVTGPAVASAPAAASQPQDQIKPKVSAGIMAGQKISGVNPIYPPQAKADKVQGAVVLALTINQEGEPEEIHVKKSVRDDLDESAITAVRQWRWKPYLLNGNPTAVDTTITITYSLQP